MRAIVSALVAVSLVATVAVPVAAETRSKKKHTYSKQYRGPPADREARRRNGSGYQEFIAEKRPFGSASWWQQMDREGRGGQSRPN
jgi:hypothetical protein